MKKVLGFIPQPNLPSWKYGMVLKVVAGKKKGLVPLADVEVISRENPNFWPVREYVVWAANQ